MPYLSLTLNPWPRPGLYTNSLDLKVASVWWHSKRIQKQSRSPRRRLRARFQPVGLWLTGRKGGQGSPEPVIGYDLPLSQLYLPLQPELSVMIAYFLFFCQPENQAVAISIAISFYPHFGPNIKKLKDFTPDMWRYRIGAWRFFFEIDEEEKVAFMVAASHRSSAYWF